MIKQITYQVELLTPSFCKIGFDQPEIRGASIRGMIREWKRNRGGRPDAIWGGAGGKASKVGIDIKSIQTNEGKHPLLPHKDGPKTKAIETGGAFTLVLNRLVGCTDALWREAKSDVEIWLLLGCLGQRANRAAGSVWCGDWQFSDIAAFQEKLRELRIPQTCDIRICTTPMTAEKVRETASDTVENIEYFGSFKPRTPSPTKMKVVKVDGSFHLLLFAGNANILDGALQLLNNKHDNHRWGDLEFVKV